MIKSRKFWFSLVFALVLGFALHYGADALAQSVNTGLNFGAQTGLSAQDPKVTVAKAIRIGLGFLGIIAVGLIMYAGFLWMSAKGNEEKIDQAKKILVSAAIGLGIILAAFAIASFIISRLLAATGGDGGSGTGCVGPDCSTIDPSGGDAFAVRGITPAHQSVNIPRNATVRVEFTKPVNPDSVTTRSFIVTRKEGKPLLGSRSTFGTVMEFAPEANCDVPNDTLKCFPENATIVVEARNEATISSPVSGGNNLVAEGLVTEVANNDKSGIVSINGQRLSCSGNSRCVIEFTTGNYIDSEAPHVNLTSTQVCASTNNTLRASAIDNYGVSKIDFYAGEQPIGSQLNNSSPFIGSPYSATVTWNPGSAAVGQTVLLKAMAYDLDSNNATASKSLKLAEAHCCNGIKDGDETGPDCGGSCESCAAQGRPRIDSVTPAGGFCTNDVNKSCSKDADCGSNAQCDLGTPNGATGNLITIIGQGFGTVPGKVFMLDGTRRIEAKLANDPADGNPKCGDGVWSPNQIIAIVPALTSGGAIAIETKDNGGDATDDAFGPLLNNFKKNTIVRPGLCMLNPSKGQTTSVLSYSGLKLAASKAYFGSFAQADPPEALSSKFDSDSDGSAGVPSLATGQTTTFVVNKNIASNYLAFTKESDPYDGPIIVSIVPASGPIGQYVTIIGSGFGGARGSSKVYFGDASGKEADYAFPDACAASVWTDKQIIVKVPNGIATGSYKLTIVRDGYAPVDSGATTFQVTAGTPAPGLCRLDPVLGQENSAVTAWGEYFQNKDNNSAIIFSKSLTQNSAAISTWEIDQSAAGLKPWKAVTTVPRSATSGPVRVSVGAPAQLSNSINFNVGSCTQDADCGTGATCCAAGLPEGGKCKSDSAQCYGSILTSVYEWQFSTGAGTGSCPSDTETCGAVCCVGGCDPSNPNKCQSATCGETQSQCGDGTCCDGACEEGINGGPSTCSDPDDSICATITDPVECSQHEECCVDGRQNQNNKCVKANPGQPRIPENGLTDNPFDKTGDSNETPGGVVQYCGYFKCAVDGGVNSCFNTAVKDGPYKLQTACQQGCVNAPIACSDNKLICSNPSCPANMRCDMGSCTCKVNNPPPQEVCKNPLTQQCNNSCSEGYQCLTPFANGAAPVIGQENPENTCRCCCKPPTAEDPTDTCKDIDPGLSCLANQDACTGANRGACCGCTKDAQCGDTATTGCGQTGSDCCRARPLVSGRYPAPDATGVCRNAAIAAFFNQRMDLSSFSGNILLIGDYGGGACPRDYDPVTMSEPTGRFAKLFQPLKKFMARVAPALMTKDALAVSSNYCKVAGSIIGSDVSSASSKASFRLEDPLDANRKYYVVVQGDPALAHLSPTQQKDYYDDKITSLSKIGLSALGGARPIAFNNTTYDNAAIWSFTTGPDVCTLDSVNVSPNFHLFQKTGDASGIDLYASPQNRGQVIDPIPGVYDWTWNWESANSEVARVEPQPDQPQAAKAYAGGKKDAQTLGKAKATITVDTHFRPSTTGRQVVGTAQLRSFLCENPWPVFYSFMPPPGFSWPWKDDATGIEFYYCRDNDAIGTSDDLPALKDSPLAQTGGRKVCMSGSNQGKTCTSDAQCGNIAGSCWPELLKEFFFFREATPGKPVISGTVDPLGQKVTLRWQPTANASKYKIYYGSNPGQYNKTIEVPGSTSEIARTISGLVNNVNYYFVVTALSDKNQETAFSNELKLRPRDTTAPEKPAVIGSGGVDADNDSLIGLFWAPVPDAVSYIAYLGSRPRTGNEQYATSKPVTSVPAANTPNTIFPNLDPNVTYYLAVRAVDMYGNQSDYSSEIQVRPNRPYLMSATPLRGSIALRWAPFSGGQGYEISMTTTGGGRPVAPVSVSASTFEYTVTGLAAAEYTFTVKAKKEGGQLSDASNELKATPR